MSLQDRKRQRDEEKQKPGGGDERGAEEDAGEAAAEGGEEGADTLKEEDPESEDTEDEQPEPNFNLPDDLKVDHLKRMLRYCKHIDHTCVKCMFPFCSIIKKSLVRHGQSRLCSDDMLFKAHSVTC